MLAKEIHDFDDEQCKMRSIGTAHLVEVMDAYDLLPVHNFQYGKHKDIDKIHSTVWEKRFTQGIFDGCWYGCHMACAKGADCHKVMTGPYKGHIVTVDGPEYETCAGLGSNCGIFEPDWILESNFYCDTYGIDTISVRHLLRVRHGVLAARHPERGADRRPRPDRGATASRTSRCSTRWRAARGSASSSARA